MDPQLLTLAKNAARLSLVNAGIFAGAYFIIDVLSKIPIVGVVFFCLNALLSLAAFFAIAYLETPKLFLSPPVRRSRCSRSLLEAGWPSS